MNIYHPTNYRKNLITYWRQYHPDYQIPAGYHVHHIKPRCTFKDKNDPSINHPSNLIALHPDDHYSIHRCRGDKYVNGFLSVGGARKRNKQTINQSHILRVTNMKDNVDTDGLDAYQRATQKAANTKLTTVNEFGENGYDLISKLRTATMNQTDSDGLTGYQRVMKKRAATMLTTTMNTYPELFNPATFSKLCLSKTGRLKVTEVNKTFNISRYKLYMIKEYLEL